MPHCRVLGIDASAALAMEGVVAILTADEVPEQPGPANNILTNEPHFVGEPILAVAAVTETIAQNAIEAIELDLEALPFCVDPLESLRPGGPNARTDGNTVVDRTTVQEVKWTEQDFAAAGEGELPMGEPGAEWSYGDIDAGFAEASIILDETFVTAGTSHHSMEPRTAMAYWQNGKCYLHASTQSQSFVHPGIAAYIGIEPEESGLHRRVLRWWLRLERRGIPPALDSGAHVTKDAEAGAHEDQPRGGVRPRLGPARLPGSYQDGIPGRRPDDRGRPVYRTGERPEHGFHRSGERGERSLDRIHPAQHALSGGSRF